jgi:sulfite reductase (NADPH) hemoprotein beta-component
MLRIAIPYGSLNPTQLRKLALIGRTYDKGYGHFTTRTNLQFHWIKLSDAPDILDHLARWTCTPSRPAGNCIRNVTADPYAGATAEEIDDPRVWAEAIRQWSTVHPEFSWLPRKFKIAVTAAPEGQDGGQDPRHRLNLKRARDGSLGFEVMVAAGSAGCRTSRPTIREFLPARACSRTGGDPSHLNRHGRARQHPQEARIKILVAALGPRGVRRLSGRGEWEKIGLVSDLPDTELAPHPRRLPPKSFETPAGDRKLSKRPGPPTAPSPRSCATT